MIAAVFAAIVWILADQQVFDPANQTILTWIVLVAIATIMGVGVSWSHVRRRSQARQMWTTSSIEAIQTA